MTLLSAAAIVATPLLALALALLDYHRICRNDEIEHRPPGRLRSTPDERS